MASPSKGWIGRCLPYGLGILFFLVSLNLLWELGLSEGEGVAVSIPFILVVILAFRYKRKAAASDEENRKLMRALRAADLRTPFECMYRPAFRLGNVNVEQLKRASDLCDKGDFEAVTEALVRPEEADALDYAAFYLRGRAHFGAGFSARALEDFNLALMCLKHHQGVVESARAEPYIASEEWDGAKDAAKSSIEHMALARSSNVDFSSGPAVQWIPHLYLAIAHETSDRAAAEEALREMMDIRPLPSQSEREFVVQHPLLRDFFQENSRLRGAVSEWIQATS